MGESSRWRNIILAAGAGLAASYAPGKADRDSGNKDSVCEAEYFKVVNDSKDNSKDKGQDLEPKIVELPPQFLRTDSLYNEINRGEKVNPVVLDEWERISKEERRKMYERRFGNLDKYVEKYFSKIIENTKLREQVAHLVVEAAEKYGVPIDIILGVIGTESGGDPGARSDNKPEARGIMQLLPLAAREMGLKVELENGVDERFDSKKSIKAAVGYLKNLKDYFGSYGVGLIAYSSGRTRLEDVICRHYPEIESRVQRIGTKDYRLFTKRGRAKFLELVDAKEISIVHLYSKVFEGLGAAHPYQYPFYVDEMSRQMSAILTNGEPIPVLESLDSAEQKPKERKLAKK